MPKLEKFDTIFFSRSIDIFACLKHELTMLLIRQNELGLKSIFKNLADLSSYYYFISKFLELQLLIPTVAKKR